MRLGSGDGAAHRSADPEAGRDVHDRLRILGRGAGRRRRAALAGARRLRRGGSLRSLRREPRDAIDWLERAAALSATIPSRSLRWTSGSRRFLASRRPALRSMRRCTISSARSAVSRRGASSDSRSHARDHVHHRHRHHRRHCRSSAARDRGGLPPAQDQGRRRGRPAAAAGRQGGDRRAGARRRERGLDLESAHALLPQCSRWGSSSSSSRSRPTTSRASTSSPLRARRADRGRRGMPHAARHPRDRALRRRRQHQAREERRHPRGGAHDLGRAGARHGRDDRLHDRELGRHRAGRADRVARATSSTSTVTCCSPRTRSRASASWTARSCCSGRASECGRVRCAARMGERVAIFADGLVRDRQRQGRTRAAPLRRRGPSCA